MKVIQDLRQKSDDQLKNRLNDIEISLRRTRGENKAGKPNKNSMFIQKLRKEKARILTILREREIKRQHP